MTDLSRRIQLRRIKGWRKPPGCIVCSRSGGKWGNLYPIGDLYTREQAIHRHRQDILSLLEVHPDLLHPLRNHDLACWCRLCPDHAEGKPLGITCDACAPCHTDTLLELANA